MTVIPQSYVSVQEYLALETQAQFKSEYLNGQMYAMVGNSGPHNIIISNLLLELAAQLRGMPCRPFVSDQRLVVSRTGLYTYPDLMIVCGERVYSESDPNSLTNPQIIIEVLSPSTEQYDRTVKLRQYIQIPSLQEYLMISQTRTEITHLSRRDNFWGIEIFLELNETVSFSSINLTLALRDIYREVGGPTTEVSE
jgi:Uma2 family endonuclease